MSTYTTYTVQLTEEQMDNLSDACAYAEQLWRFRSHHPEMFVYSASGESIYSEEFCREQMKLAREASKDLWSTCTSHQFEVLKD